MYLNDFRVEKILEVIEEIKLGQDSDLLLKVSISKDDIGKIGFLYYNDSLHLLEANLLNPLNGPLYPNPDMEILIIPKDPFIKKVVPSAVYRKLRELIND